VALVYSLSVVFFFFFPLQSSGGKFLFVEQTSGVDSVIKGAVLFSFRLTVVSSSSSSVIFSFS